MGSDVNRRVQHPTQPASRVSRPASQSGASGPGTPDLEKDTIEIGRDASESSAELPVAIGPYRILAELGRGGMGVVYRAVDDRLQREVALKTITGEPDEETRRRFMHECRAIARLRHAGIVGVYEAAEHDARLVMALELVEGESLAARIARAGALPTRKAATIVKALAEAVEAAHGAGVIHRDLKPANVLLDLEGRTRLTDFGLARSDAASLMTQTGLVIGSPAYMAPEQALSEHAKVGPRTDIYGLGAVLYECLTARPPFRGGTPVDVLRRVIDEEVEPPSKVRDRAGLSPLPPQLETICLRALEKDPEKRYPTADAMATDLARFLAGERVRARRSSPHVRVRRWAGKHRALVSGASVAVVLGAVGLVAVGLALRTARDPVADAEREARAAAATIEAARGDAARLRAAVAARKAAARYHAIVAPGDAARAEQAARLLFDVLMAIGAAAERTGALDIAEDAYDDARAELDVDDDAARAALARVEALRAEAPVAETAGSSAEAEEPAAAPPATEPQNPFDLDDAARRALLRQDADAALAIYDRGLERFPGDLGLLFGRARARESVGDHDGALRDLEEVLSRRPGHPESLSLEGVCLIRLGRHEEGVELGAAAARADPGSWEVWWNRAKGQHLLGRHEEAAAFYSKVIELEPRHAEAWRWRGIAYMELGEGHYEQAVGSLYQATELNPNLSDYFQDLSAARQKLGQHDAALVSIQRAIDLREERALHWFARGDIFETRHREGGGPRSDLDRALEDYAKAIDLGLEERYRGIAEKRIARIREELGRW